MNKKSIAVITNNIPTTFEWLRSHSNINKIDVMNKVAYSDNETYVLIMSIEDANGWEFSGFIKPPFYESVEDVVKSRIR